MSGESRVLDVRDGGFDMDVDDRALLALVGDAYAELDCVCVYVCIYVCMYVCMCVCVCVYACLYVYVCMHACMCVYI